MLARTINLSLITLVFADKSDRNNSSIIRIYKLVHTCVMIIIILILSELELTAAVCVCNFLSPG